MLKVILSSLSDHLKAKLDYIPKISQLDPDTLGYIERILDFHSDIDGILEYIMVTKAALIRGHKRNIHWNMKRLQAGDLCTMTVIPNQP